MPAKRIGLAVDGDDTSPDVPVGAAGAEIVFNHPLAKSLVCYRDLIVDAKLLDQGNFLGAGRRDDTIDH